MSFSRLCRRSNLFPCIKNLQHTYPEARCMPNILGWSSYNLIGANTGYQRHNNYDIWGLNLRCEFSTRSFYKHSRYSPFVSGYAVRSFPSLKFQRCYASLASREQKSRKILLYLTALVLAMVGSSYAAVPLYRRFCQATGYGGTVQRRESVEEKIARHAKDGTVATLEIVVQFNADVADRMPWKFVPTQREVRVKPGESALAFYTAENRSSAPITGVSTYNITPMKFTLTKFNAFALRSSVFFPGSRLTCLYSFILILSSKQIPEWYQ